jgi:phosphoribosylaminoimidazole (AIR) synthetase
MTYKDAGVDIDAGTELVRRIAKMAPGIGGFGGLLPWGKIPQPLFFALVFSGRYFVCLVKVRKRSMAL